MFPIPQPQFAEMLEVIESYQYFDRPVLFACHDTHGQIYLVVWADEDEDNQTETWIFTPIHEGLWQAVRAGAIELKVAFQSGIDDYAYVVHVDWNTQTSKGDKVTSSELNLEWLPDAGERLESRLERRPLDLEAYAKKNNLTAADLQLKPTNPTIHAVPARLVGGVLQSFQGVFEALLQSFKMDDPKQLGRIPKEIVEQAVMMVDAFAPGSFNMRLSLASTDLYDDIDRTLQQLALIIKAGDNETELKKHSKVITSRFSARYGLFLQKVAAGGGDLHMYWATSHGVSGSAQIAARQAASAARVVREIQEAEENEIVLEEVELIGINTSTKRFELQDIETSTRYSGNFSKDFDTNSPYTIHKNYLYEAVVAESTEINNITFEEKTNYKLKSLTPKS